MISFLTMKDFKNLLEALRVAKNAKDTQTIMRVFSAFAGITLSIIIFINNEDENVKHIESSNVKAIQTNTFQFLIKYLNGLSKLIDSILYSCISTDIIEPRYNFSNSSLVSLYSPLIES